MTKFYLSFSRYLTVLLLFITTIAWSQSRTVTGKVNSSEDGNPLPGVSIVEKGTTNGTVSDADGNFSINVGANPVLVFSFVGYKTMERVLGSESSLDIQLESDVTALSEVVVVGYGEVKKTDATGAVAVVSQEKFNKGFQTSAEQLIQGRVAGVQITSTSGEPGASSNIRIRGASSIRSGNNPLIVLDGVPLDGRDVSAGADVGAGRQSARNPLNFINPADIETMNILKDASATAIYGSRGANGVIIITTKKGRQGKPQLSYSTSLGFSKIPEGRKYDLLSASEFADAAPAAQDFGDDVDAFKAITQTGTLRDHNLTYGGGTDKGSYRISLSLQDQEGVIKNTGLTKYSGSVNLQQQVLDGRVTLQSSLIASVVQDEAAALSDNVGAEGDMLISALRWNPTRAFRDGDGVLDQPSDNVRNPLAFLEYYDDNTETTRIFGNASATVKIIEGLDYKINFGIDRSNSERRVAVSRLLNANFARNSGIGNIQNISGASNLIEHTLTYNKTLDNNTTLNFLAGYSYQQFNRQGSNLRGTNFLIDDQSLYTNNLDFASSYPANQNSSFKNPKDELQSFFGRANVNLLDKFLITATMRADGSSRFGKNNKYGYFPSAAIAYRLSEESFTPELFSDLKIRAGWGITGNQEFPPGNAQDQFRPLGDGSGIQKTVVGNPDLKWETTSQINIGLDFGFFENRLTGTIDYFSKNTEDLLFRLRTAQPGPDVFVWRNLENVTVDNSGLELSLDGVIIDREDLVVDLGFNISFFKNEINNVSKQFPLGIITGEINGQGLSNQRSQLLYDGQPLYAFYLATFTGFDENGNGTFADLNGNGLNDASIITAPGLGDRSFVGNPNPNKILGIRSSVKYKRFDAGIYFNGMFGHKVFDNTALALFSAGALNGGANVDKRVLSSGQDIGDAPVPSTLFLEKGDFLRLSNLSVGYSFNQPVKFIESLRLYATGQNLFVITKYKGFDPEVNTNKAVDDVPSFGIDYASYPRPRIFTLGLNVVF